jgi:hypothetical protein
MQKSIVLVLALAAAQCALAATDAEPGQAAVAAAAAPAASAASAPVGAVSQVAAAQVCHREQILGSYRSQTVCYTPGGPNDPNVSSAAADLARQIGLNQAMGARAGKN